MKAFDRKLPPVLARLHRLPFDDDEGEGIDFEPYEQFESARETTGWLRAWTGNEEVEGGEFRIFGQEAVGKEVKAGSGKKNAAFTDFAMKHAPEAKKSPSAVVRAARKEFPDFEKTIRALRR
ncbi:hypothetical protein [Archangium sp.]|uniref:hypothetical protein n=1 Tax=Archangium sp. TaxID=1872627 RepID=UPI002D3AAD3F|nr:hypothetical protein [Archangium sp.]HYO51444.1 hypothetical protein [Archangium sp.]